MRHTHERELRDLVRRVRRRWMIVSVALVFARAAAATSAIVIPAVLLERVWQPGAPGLVFLGGAVVALVLVLVACAIRPVLRVPRAGLVARFVEERCPELEDRLVSALHFAGTDGGVFHDLVAADAASFARTIDLERLISRSQARRAFAGAALGVATLVVSGMIAADGAARASRAAWLYAFPATIDLQVLPGDARVPAGRPFSVLARVRAPFGLPEGVEPLVDIGSDETRQVIAMSRAGEAFAFDIPEVTSDFTYRVTVGSTASPLYRVTALFPPRVTRIDLDYEYPPFTGLERRTEEDGGDIYAPAGTRVRLQVFVDKPVRTAALVMDSGGQVELVSSAGRALESALTIKEDGSYRVALADEDGLTSSSETEYFIRVMNDRPPSVRIVRPVNDRQVTPLEEVAIDVRADDDYGLERVELVYSVRGAAERVARLYAARGATSVAGSHTLYLEDLKVQPGDFVAYYARARDVSRGKQSTEARSDIFFLEVKPFEEEFRVSEGMSGMTGSGGPMEDLATAQKEIIIATWKLDRRSTGGSSQSDILSIARAQGELKRRAQQVVGPTPERDPRRGRPGSQPPPQENPLVRAVAAMGQAEAALDALKTADALPHELTALNELLKADAESRRRQVARQQRGGGSGSGRSGQDLSALFDRELQRQQQTNYETPKGAAQQENEQPESEALRRVRELARRQDALSQEQRDLARQVAQMTPEELKRQLERLTREQTELRREAEELARQLAAEREARSAAGTQSGESGTRAGDDRERLRDASEEMRGATRELRRQDPAGAAARSDRAADRLRDLERQLRDAQPDERRRALGDLQLESRQLADAERRMAEETRHLKADPANDLTRRLAGERERLAERVDKLRRGASELAATAEGRERSALEEAARELEEGKIADRLRESASSLRNRPTATKPEAAPGRSGQKPQDQPRGDTLDPTRMAQSDEELAKALDRVAERLGAAGAESGGETAELSDDLNRARELRERLGEIERQLDAAMRGGQQPGRGDQQGNGNESRTPSERAAQAKPGNSSSAGGTEGAGLGDEVARLREEYVRELQKAEQLLDDLRRENPELDNYLPSSTGTLPTNSAPGTESFKQDFTSWEMLKREVALALEKYEASRSRELAENEIRDRLNVGGSSEMPPEYRRLVEEYYRLLAAKKKP